MKIMNIRDLEPRYEWLNKHIPLCFHKKDKALLYGSVYDNSITFLFVVNTFVS